MADKPSMRPERLRHIKDQYERWGEAALERACGELLAEIDRLRSPPGDAEVAHWVELLSQQRDPLPDDYDTALSDLLTRLSASLSAMRERTEKAEAERDAARSVGLENYNRACRERDEALAALEKARADVLNKAELAAHK